MLTYTQYGKQKSRKNPENRMENGNDKNINQLAGSEDIGGYAVWGLSAGYNLKDTISIRVGVSNLFDKRIYRSSSSTNYNAHTYNEPGRAYYATVKYFILIEHLELIEKVRSILTALFYCLNLENSEFQIIKNPA